jgi:hypothetical protein
LCVCGFSGADAPTDIAGFSKLSIDAKDVLTESVGVKMSIEDVLTAVDQHAMQVRDQIDQMNEITRTGIYFGPKTATTLKILDAPIDGNAMIMAARDAHDNWGYLFMGQDMVLRSGGKPKGSSVITWKAEGKDAFIPLADKDLDMATFAIHNLKDPRTGVAGKDDAVNKHSMDEALASRSLYQGAYAPASNSPDLVTMTNSDFAPLHIVFRR